MKKLFSTLMIIIAFVAQAQNFENLVSDISSSLQNVQAAKKEFKQSIEVVKPGVVSLHLEIVPEKGDTKTKDYVFSPYDLDKNTIRASAKGDVISVQLLTKNGQKMIRQTLDNEKVSYVNKIYVQATDMKNGKELAEKLKKLIPVAKKIIDARLNLNSYDDYKNWLENNTGEVNLPNKQINQSIEIPDEVYGKTIINQEVTDSKKTIKHTYKFNALSLQSRTIGLKVSGDIFYVVLKAKKPLIKHLVDEQHKNFVKEVKVAFSDIEKARDFKKVMQEFIPIAKKKFMSSLPKISNIKEALHIINQNIENLQGKDIQITQTLSGNCVMEVEQNIQGKKNEHTYKYKFNLADINPNALEIATEKGLYVLKIKTVSGNKFIQPHKDGELNSYTNNIKIYNSGIETALTTQQLFKNMIDKCKQKMENQKVPSSENELKDKLSDHIRTVETGDKTYEQQIEFGDENSVKYTRNETGKKSTTEYLYEFYLQNINPNAIKFRTSGKNVYVELKTNGMEKAVKYYKDGKIGKYQNTIKIYATGIENARNLTNFLKKLTEIYQK